MDAREIASRDRVVMPSLKSEATNAFDGRYDPDSLGRLRVYA
jgi:hypothetical protein